MSNRKSRSRSRRARSRRRGNRRPNRRQETPSRRSRRHNDMERDAEMDSRERRSRRRKYMEKDEEDKDAKEARRSRRRPRRRSRRRRQADPYQMNQDHSQRPVEKYETGNPSTWAEDPHPSMPEVGRNELGMPEMGTYNMDHKDVDQWNSGGPYDNERQARRQRSAAMEAKLEKKAYQCIKIARHLFPKAADEVVEEQALDLMSLADQSVISTVIRLAGEQSAPSTTSDSKSAQTAKNAEDEEEEKEEEMEEEMEEEEKAEEKDEEKEEGSDKEAASETPAPAQDGQQDVVSKLRDLLASEQQPTEQYDHKDVQAAVAGETGIQEPDQIESMLASLDADLTKQASNQGMDINLSPPMDAYDADAMTQGDPLLDRVLQSGEVQQQINEKTAADKRGVRSLGRVKEADSGSQEGELSKLWKSRPDVSRVFNG